MGKKPWVVDDELWVRIEPLLPERSPGPRPVDDRLCLQGIPFVSYTGIAWHQLPPEWGFGSGQTCRRRLGRRQEAGVFEALHRLLLAELNAAGLIGWTRARVDASHVHAEKRGEATGPSPVDRRKTGSKHHVISDGGGIPFHVIVTAANVNDVTRTLDLVDGVPPVAGRVGRPRKCPAALLGGKGYDSNPNRRELHKRRILPVISHRDEPDIIDIGKLCYVVAQTFAQLHQFKRLAIRWERRLDLHNAFVSLTCALICWRRLNKPTP
ncbi:IS5 family transposase [Kitasatospora sp. YST-16]|uniref:IS5 family transposase n=1 Tax=Kitasatospora sp. YST-16 TaxID=2998080 RepID=UPI002283ABEE|nr:IS5 family transposase [Kitasatospora sp. YST-16]WAL70314.1 IS5 family transposase [Kitasatospora sp. YST-16]WNW36356.1 IS5 family transposase [Streptomyces sp. Li-HN-5-13]